jgi:hypothetical protein
MAAPLLGVPLPGRPLTLGDNRPVSITEVVARLIEADAPSGGENDDAERV